MRKFIILIVGLVPLFMVAQTNSYQQAAGKDYWKNRKPFEGYWQQDVHYKIQAVINDTAETVTGTESLTYYNNSPDTLYTVYFHLYQNAFTPNSYAHNLAKAGKIKVTFGENEAKGIGTHITSFKVGGKDAEFSIDNTILIVKLQEPIYPSSSQVFDIQFETFWDKHDGGSLRRRMKTFEHDGVTHFDGVHWYPRICVYDRKFGWSTDQHLGKEFYGDFGLFEVELTFPNQYIVEATGELQNTIEVLPPALREAIDIKNYKTQRSDITKPIIADGTTKTWKYKAVNVHDFAFTADPTYRMAEVEWNGIKCIALAQEQNAHRWQQTAAYVAKIVELYSTEIGMFGYPKMVAADARDGMEYPMLTLNSGNWPGHQYVIAHEVGHNWFFGMVGNNETYRSSLDEGFTQWLTALSLKKLSNQDFDNNNLDKSVVFNSYMYHAAGDNNATLNVHADHYNSAERHGGGYGQVYFKTATMLYNLQYVLGDDLFKAAIQNYFEQWKYGHPYWEDFRNSVIHYTKADLNWFFDEWIETTQVIDYEVGKVKFEDDKSSVILKRKGRMQMPLDVEVIYKDGVKEMVYIPNTYFKKKNVGNVQSTWIGWDLLNTEYKLTVSDSRKIKQVTIDPSGRLADVYRLDNYLKKPQSFKFSKFQLPIENYANYTWYWHPNIWYNAVDGIKAGIDFNGHYYANKHVFKSTIWYNSGIGSRNGYSPSIPLSYSASYSNSLPNNLSWKVQSRVLDGLSWQQIGLKKEGNNATYRVYVKSLFRKNENDLNYLIYNNLWQKNRFNNTVNLSIEKHINVENGNAKLNIQTSGSYLVSDYNYAYLNMEFLRNFNLKKLDFRTRLFAQTGTGNFAPESKLMLAGANNEEMMDNPWMRSAGFAPASWEGYGVNFNHLHYGGGLNLRGFSGYAVTNGSEQNPFILYSGTSGFATNIEVDFTNLVPIKNKIKGIRFNSYLFGDAGWLKSSNLTTGFRADAGVGIASTLSFAKYNVIKPIAIRVDFPLFVNRIPAGEKDYFAFRYVLGISRAF